ncbi:MAG: hypothetical protein JO040_09765 [Gemmatimonadetes bacterium]|nr:hypothetical protein [Gemmatimonadota bacterium]
MKHEERHAVAMWLVAAVLGGFAVLYWAVGRSRGDGTPPPRPPVEIRDTTRA